MIYCLFVCLLWFCEVKSSVTFGEMPVEQEAFDSILGPGLSKVLFLGEDCIGVVITEIHGHY